MRASFAAYVIQVYLGQTVTVHNFTFFWWNECAHIWMTHDVMTMCTNVTHMHRFKPVCQCQCCKFLRNPCQCGVCASECLSCRVNQTGGLTWTRHHLSIGILSLQQFNTGDCHRDWSTVLKIFLNHFLCCLLNFFASRFHPPYSRPNAFNTSTNRWSDTKIGILFS